MLIDLIVNCVNSNCIDYCPTTGTPVCAEYAYNGQNLILAYQNSCLAECDGFTNSDYTDCTHTFDCFDNCPQDYKPVCIEVTLPNNLTVTYVYYNSCIAECEGFTSADFISCN